MKNGKERKTYRVRRMSNHRESGKGESGAVLPSEAWVQAEVLTDFSFPWSKMSVPETVFRALWDDERFCFRFEVTDRDVVLEEGGNTMEKVIGSDRVEIFFTTGDDLDPYYGLEIDPRGEVLAYETRHHRQFNWDWSCPGLEVWSELTEKGYRVEGVIPLGTFRTLGCLHERNGCVFLQAGLFRAEFSHGSGNEPVIEDWISWVDPGGETPDFHVPSAFGVLNFEAA